MAVKGRIEVRSGIVTLLTDFGTRDPYVAAVKGVILSIHPHASIVDVSHDVDPRDIVEAASLLESVFPFFPAGTVHLAVVDPGVGSQRLAVAAYAAGQYFVGPDNGVLFPSIAHAQDVEAVTLSNPEYLLSRVHPTFHGRDLFAPAAAHLSLGASLGALGPRIGGLTPLELQPPNVTPDAIFAEVMRVDRFGNLITNLDAKAFEAWRSEPGMRVAVEVGGVRMGSLNATYGDVESGELLVLFESSDHLEVAVRDGSAAEKLGVGRGASVVIRRA